MRRDRGKYANRIDAELWAYVDEVVSHFPPGIAEMPVAAQRAAYDAMCRQFHPGQPPGVETQDDVISAPGRQIPFRRYRLRGRPATAAVIYYHGGGFVFGGLESHDDICAELCAKTGFAVYSIDYRLAPEHVHPAAFDDALSAFRHLSATAGVPIVLCGESAGGSLSAAVALETRGETFAAVGQVLIYPGLGGDVTKGSYMEHAEAPLLSLDEVKYYESVRGVPSQAHDPTFAPLQADDFTGLPATVIVTAECDPLSSDGETYRDCIVVAGGKAAWLEEPRLVHSFLRARRTVKRAGEAFEHIVAAVAALGAGDWPYRAVPNRRPLQPQRSAT